MKKIIALMITLIMCMTISVIPVMAMETSPCSENAIETASIEATNHPVVASANIIYPTQTTFSVTKTITRIQHQGSASNLNGFIQVKFTNLTTGATYNRVFVTDNGHYTSNANMEAGRFKIETVGGTYGILYQLTLNFS